MVAHKNFDERNGTSVSWSASTPIHGRDSVPIIEIQGSTHIVSFVNSAFCRLLGKSKKELIGRPFSEVVPGGNEREQILRAVDQTAEAATPAREYEPDLDPACWLYTMWPALDVNESPTGVIIQFTRAANFRLNTAAINEALLISGLRQHELAEGAEKLNAQLQKEITVRRTAEASLLEARDRLADRAGELERLVAERTEKLHEMVGELQAFSYSVAHDLRAPLRAVQGYASILLEGYADRLDETGRSYLQRMERASIRMDKLIQDVLSYTKILRDVQMEAIALDPLLRDLIDAYEDWQPPKADIQIDGTLPNVAGNEALLGQCLSNLITNAIKFVTPGTKPKVRIRAESMNENVRIWIADNGLGIAPENHSRIFRMFERVYTASEYSGTGIGLTIVRKAMERMGGRVGFESALGKGSRFWIELQKAKEP
jgi:signal transduction histidine kinase